MLRALRFVHVKQESWDKLAQVLQQEADTAELPEERLSSLLNLAQVYVAKLDQAHLAIPLYQSILADAPMHSDALAALHELAGQQKEPAADAVQVLIDHYRAQAHYEKLPGLYVMAIPLARDPEHKYHLHTELVSLWEQELGDLRAATEAAKAMVLTRPNEGSLERLERLAFDAGVPEMLAGVVEEAVAVHGLSAASAVSSLLRAARWYQEWLDQPTQAEHCLRQALVHDPSSLDVHQTLIALLRQVNNEEALLKALVAYLDFVDDSAIKAELLVESARLAEQSLKDETQALALYHQLVALDWDPTTTRQALRALQAIHAGREDWSSWVGVSEQLLRHIDEPEARSAQQLALSDVYRDKLNKAKGADALVEQAFRDNPDDLRVLDAVSAVYESRGEWQALREVLEQRLTAVATDYDRIAIRVRLVKIAEKEHGNLSEAIAQLEEILTLDPLHEDAVETLQRLLRQTEDWPALGELYARYLSHPDVPELWRKRIRRDQAWLDYQHLGDAQRAAETLRALADEDPKDATLIAQLVEVYSSLEQWPALSEMLQLQMAQDDAQSALAASLRQATLAEETLDDLERAEQAWQRAYALAPDDHRDALVEFLRRHARFDALMQLFADECARSTDVKGQASLHKDMAMLAWSDLHDADKAADCIEKALAIDPSDVELVLFLADIYMDMQRWDEAIKALSTHLEIMRASHRPKVLARLHHKLGKVYECADRMDEALQSFNAAFRMDINNVSVLHDLGKLHCRLKDWQQAQKNFRALLLQRLDKNSGITKADIYFHLGEISAAQGDTRRAQAMLKRALNEQADHVRATELLAQLSGDASLSSHV